MIRAVLAAVVVSGALVAWYLSEGGGDYDVAQPPAPCQQREAPSGGEGLTAVIQRVAFTALDTAACDLKVSRERLLLALTGQADLPAGVTEEQRNEAFKQGLRAAVDEEEQQGTIPDAIVPLLKNGIDLLPVDQLIERFFESGGGGFGP